MNKKHAFYRDHRRPNSKPRLARCAIESLESRTMLSVSASAQLVLLSTSGSTFHYQVDLTDTGTTDIGTFWFGWQPGQDFLASKPSAVGAPSDWTDNITGSDNSTDGSAIEWFSSNGQNLLTPGATQDAFTFSSTDSPTVLAGDSPDYPGVPAMESDVYSGQPLVGTPGEFDVTPAATQPSKAASTTTVSSSASTILFGDPVTLTASVTPTSGSGPSPTGTVAFFEDGISIGSSSIQGTAAQLVTSSLPTGDLSITADYSGDSNYQSSDSSAIPQTVSAGANFIFFVQPQDMTAGQSLSEIVVYAENASGQIDSSYEGNVTLGLKTAPTGASFSPITEFAQNGIATFNDIPALDIAGGYKLKATETGHTPGKSNKFFVNPAAATQLVFADQPTSIAYTSDEGPITADVEDQFGNIETDDSSTLVTLGVKTGPDGVTFTPLSATDDDGVATFTGVSFITPGGYKLKATSPGLTPGKSAKFFISL